MGESSQHTSASRVFFPGRDGSRLLAVQVDRVQVVAHLSFVVADVLGGILTKLPRVVLAEALDVAPVQKHTPAAARGVW